MLVLFRVDATPGTATGHLMRCMALADRLRDKGARCRFLTRPVAPILGSLIESHGHSHSILQGLSERLDVPNEPRPQKEGDNWKLDALATLEAIGNSTPDWLIVDHYGLDARWHQRLRESVERICVIDDLADRPLDCDLLVDSCPGRLRSDYEPLLNSRTAALLGADYALIRPEFGALRQESLARRRHARLEHIVISLGGGAAGLATAEACVQAISHCAVEQIRKVTIVVGPQVAETDPIRVPASDPRFVIDRHIAPEQMAQLLSSADLAIGAAGGSALERCCLGLPSLITILADNQKTVAARLQESGAAILLAAEDLGGDLQSKLESLSSSADAMAEMSRSAAAVCDGVGTERILRVLSTDYRHRRAGQARRMLREDLDTVRRWRNDPRIRQFMRQRSEVSANEHEAWFQKAQALDTRLLLIVLDRKRTPVGFVQFSKCDDGAAEWGFYVAPDSPPGSGTEICASALEYGFAHTAFTRIFGHVMPGNVRSEGLHRKLGFSEVHADEVLPESIRAHGPGTYFCLTPEHFCYLC